jgi:hypothetical protein
VVLVRPACGHHHSAVHTTGANGLNGFVPRALAVVGVCFFRVQPHASVDGGDGLSQRWARPGSHHQSYGDEIALCGLLDTIANSRHDLRVLMPKPSETVKKPVDIILFGCQAELPKKSHVQQVVRGSWVAIVPEV